MKKIIASVFAAALLLAGTNAFAQMSVAAGWVNATDKVVQTLSLGNTSSTDITELNGFYAGVSYNLPLGFVDGLGLAPGAFVQGLFGADENDHKYTDFSLNVPVNINYGLELASDFKIVAFTGPVLQLGLVKKESYTNGSNTNTTDYYAGDNPYNRFNVLWGVGAGFEVNEKYQIMVGADFGLLKVFDGTWNVLGVTYNRVATRPTQIKIGFGYNF